MKRGVFIEAEYPIEDPIYEGDIILMHNSYEFIMCIISHIYNINRIVGIIVSTIQKKRRYSLADSIEFSKRNILSIISKDEKI
jgi:hypothetical protein